MTVDSNLRPTFKRGPILATTTMRTIPHSNRPPPSCPSEPPRPAARGADCPATLLTTSIKLTASLGQGLCRMRNTATITTSSTDAAPMTRPFCAPAPTASSIQATAGKGSSKCATTPIGLTATVVNATVSSFLFTASVAGQAEVEQQDPCQAKSKVVADATYCDRYWECLTGQRELYDCPNGLVWVGKNRGIADGCDYPWRNPTICRGKDLASKTLVRLYIFQSRQVQHDDGVLIVFCLCRSPHQHRPLRLALWHLWT